MCFPVFTVFQHLSSVCLLVFSQYDSDISAYTVERTLDMEKRSALLRELSRNKKRRGTVRRSCRALCFSAAVRHSTDLFEYIADIFSWFVAWQLKNFSLLYMWTCLSLVNIPWLPTPLPWRHIRVLFAGTLCGKDLNDPSSINTNHCLLSVKLTRLKPMSLSYGCSMLFNPCFSCCAIGWIARDVCLKIQLNLIPIFQLHNSCWNGGCVE